MPIRRESQSEEIKDYSQSWIYRIIAYLSVFFPTLVITSLIKRVTPRRKDHQQVQLEDYKFDVLNVR
jgi:hypothetical protein